MRILCCNRCDPVTCTYQGPVSQKSRNFTGHFRVSQLPLYLKNGEDLSRQTSQSLFFLLPWKHFKRSAFQIKRLALSQMAFRARKVFGTFEKRPPGCISWSTPGTFDPDIYSFMRNKIVSTIGCMIQGRHLFTNTAFVIQICQPQKQKTLCFDSHWGSGWQEMTSTVSSL